jgi:hypothetical protein
MGVNEKNLKMKTIISFLSSLVICITGGAQHYLFPHHSNRSAHKNIPDVRSIEKVNAEKKNIKNSSGQPLRVDSTASSHFEENELLINYRAINNYNASNQHVSTKSWGYLASGEFYSYSQSDIAYNSIGKVQEFKWYYLYTLAESPEGETIEQVIEDKTTFDYDLSGNLIEEISFEKPHPTSDFRPRTKIIYEYNSNGSLAQQSRYSYDQADEVWEFMSKNRYYYEEETNRPILEERLSQLIASEEFIITNKTEYIYNDSENSVTITHFTRPFPFTDTWLPQSKEEYVKNAQNQVVSIIESRFSPDEVIFSTITREFDDSFNLIREITDRNEESFSFATDFMREYQLDSSVSLSDVYIPQTYQFDVDLEVYFDQMISKVIDFTRENNNTPWALSGESKLFYGTLAPEIDLQESTFIYPNPASDVLNTIYPANTSFRLYNTLGQIVFETVTTIDNQVLKLPSLVTGVYIYKSSIDEGRMVIR